MRSSTNRALLLALGIACSLAACDRGPVFEPEPRPPPPIERPVEQAPPIVPQSVHLALGAPSVPAGTPHLLLVKPQYALSYNGSRNVANWVSWQLDASWFGGEPRHRGRFLPDDTLPPGMYRVVHEDYTGSDFDRGHMVRSEERTRSRADNASTFLLTNVLPQRHDLNGGPWLRLEEVCQTLAQRGHRELYLTAGPVFDREPPRTIGHGVAVPDAFFKIVVVLDRGQDAASVTAATRVIAVIMPNAEGIRDEPWWRYRTSVAEIERRTGLRFFGALPEDVRAALVARVDSGPKG
jgi:endonuclease G